MVTECVNNSFLLIAIMAGLTIVSIVFNRKLNQIHNKLGHQFDSLSDSVVKACQTNNADHNKLQVLREVGSKLDKKG